MDRLPGNLSDEAVAALVRGVGSFMRQAEPRKLPPALRRLSKFRDRALAGHSAELLAALDDDDFVVGIRDWLDAGRPPLKAADREILRLVTERPAGWKERLVAPGEPPPARDASRPEPDPAESLERERKRTRRARADLRRQRLELEKLTAEAAREIAAVTVELGDARDRLAAAENEVAVARREQATAEAGAARDARRQRAAAATAEAAETSARQELREVRKELSAAKRRIRELERENRSLAARRPASAESAPRSPRKSRARRPLPVPRGRLPEEPQTLEEWLGARPVGLLIDGYNVTKLETGFAGLPLEGQRDRLVAEVHKLAVKTGVQPTIVFDGSRVQPGTSRPRRGPVKVEYSGPAESADDHIIAALEATPPHPVIVVTNDRELRARAAALGATVARSDQLLALIR